MIVESHLVFYAFKCWWFLWPCCGNFEGPERLIIHWIETIITHLMKTFSLLVCTQTCFLYCCLSCFIGITGWVWGWGWVFSDLYAEGCGARAGFIDSSSVCWGLGSSGWVGGIRGRRVVPTIRYSWCHLVVCFFSLFSWTIGLSLIYHPCTFCFCSSRGPAEGLGFFCVRDMHTSPGGIRMERLGEMLFRWLPFLYLIPKSEPLKRRLWPTNQLISCFSYRGSLGSLGWDRYIRGNHWMKTLYVLAYRATVKIVTMMCLDLGHIYKPRVKCWTHQGRVLANDPCSLLLMYDVAAVAKWKAQYRASQIWWDQRNTSVLLCTVWLLLFRRLQELLLMGFDAVETWMQLRGYGYVYRFFWHRLLTGVQMVFGFCINTACPGLNKQMIKKYANVSINVAVVFYWLKCILTTVWVWVNGLEAQLDWWRYVLKPGADSYSGTSLLYTVVLLLGPLNLLVLQKSNSLLILFSECRGNKVIYAVCSLLLQWNCPHIWLVIWSNVWKKGKNVENQCNAAINVQCWVILYMTTHNWGKVLLIRARSSVALMPQLGCKIANGKPSNPKKLEWLKAHIRVGWFLSLMMPTGAHKLHQGLCLLFIQEAQGWAIKTRKWAQVWVHQMGTIIIRERAVLFMDYKDWNQFAFMHMYRLSNALEWVRNFSDHRLVVCFVHNMYRSRRENTPRQRCFVSYFWSPNYVLGMKRGYAP
ncbi:hypothetical protein Hanom_Chr15g01337251 [Helianthus anomalus]